MIARFRITTNSMAFEGFMDQARNGWDNLGILMTEAQHADEDDVLLGHATPRPRLQIAALETIPAYTIVT